jgi:hypothetical protein
VRPVGQVLVAERDAGNDSAVHGLEAALQRIGQEAAAPTGALALAGLGLDALPDALRELTALRELDLSRNRLTELPVWVDRLRALESLSVRDNRLSALPESLTALTRLKRLDLSGNHFAEIPRWLGRLDLRSVEFGDAGALIHPAARTAAAAGTTALLAYLRSRDTAAGAPIIPSQRAVDAPTAAQPPRSAPEPGRRLRARPVFITLGVVALAILAVGGVALAAFPGGSTQPAGGVVPLPDTDPNTLTPSAISALPAESQAVPSVSPTGAPATSAAATAATAVRSAVRRARPPRPRRPPPPPGR